MNLWGFETKPVLPGSGWGLFVDVTVHYRGTDASGNAVTGSVKIPDSKFNVKDGLSNVAESNAIIDALKSDATAKGLTGDILVEWIEKDPSDRKGKKTKPVTDKVVLKAAPTADEKALESTKTDYATFKTEFDGFLKTDLSISGASLPVDAAKASPEFPLLVKQAARKLQQDREQIRKMPDKVDGKDNTAKQTALQKLEANTAKLERLILRGDNILKRIDKNYANPNSADSLGLDKLVSGQSGRTGDNDSTAGSGDVSPDALVRAASGGSPSSFYMHSASGGPGGGSEFGFGASTGFGGIDGGFGGYGAGVGFGDGLYSDFTGIGSTLFGQRVDNQVTEKKLEAMIRRMMMRFDYDSLAVILHVMTARVKLTVIKAGFELVKIMRAKLKDQERNVAQLKGLAGQKNLGPGAQADLARLNNESQQANNLVQLAMGMFKQNHAALEEMSNETNSVQRDIINHKREASRSA